MTIGEQIEDEKRRIKDEKRRIEDEKRWIKDEKRRIEDEKRRIEDKKRRIEDEKLRIEDEKRTIKVEKRTIKDEKREIEDKKRKIEDEIKRRIKDEIKRRIEDEKRRAAMKELINTADIYYQSCSEKVRKAAKKFYEDIDHDNDGKVKLHEFLEFMRHEGHANMRRKFFETLDRRGRGTLGFEEVLALFYIIQSGRPFCHGCDAFVAGMYFTCSKCYQSDDNDVIFLCPGCFRKKSYTHKESHGRDQFLDNYALLALERKQRITHSTQQHRVRGTTPRDAASTSNAPNAIVRRTQHKWKPTLEKFLIILKDAGPLAHCIASIASACTIM